MVGALRRHGRLAECNPARFECADIKRYAENVADCINRGGNDGVVEGIPRRRSTIGARVARKFGYGDLKAQELTIGGLQFDMIDYGDLLHIPPGFRKHAGEGSSDEGNQCEIIHPAGGIARHLQNRPCRVPLGNLVVIMDSDLSALEYNRAKAASEAVCRENAMNGEILKGMCREILSPNHDRDFMFWSMFNGSDAGKHGIRVGISELSADGSSARVYSYCDKKPGRYGEDQVKYLFAHRGHMRFTKPSCLATQ